MTTEISMESKVLHPHPNKNLAAYKYAYNPFRLSDNMQSQGNKPLGKLLLHSGHSIELTPESLVCTNYGNVPVNRIVPDSDMVVKIHKGTELMDFGGDFSLGFSRGVKKSGRMTQRALMKEELSYILGYLTGWFEDAGKTQVNKAHGLHVVLPTNRYEIAQDAQLSLGRVGINSRLHGYPWGDDIKYKVIISLDNLNRFSELVSPSEKFDKIPKLDFMEDQFNSKVKSFELLPERCVFTYNKDLLTHREVFSANGILFPTSI